MPFYKTDPSAHLRFGDVLRGYVFLKNTIPSKSEMLDSKKTAKFELTFYDFIVNLTPCCNVRDKVFTVAPLSELRSSLVKNEYFAHDLTMINYPVPADKSIGSEDLAKLSDEERINLLNNPPIWVNLDLFIYKASPLFPNYNLKDTEYNTYMIDFKETMTIRSNLVVRENELLHPETKILELSVETRKQLRDKLSNYYGRVPDEDKLFLLS